MSDIETDSHANDPAATGNYDGANPTWIGETFTFNGGASSTIDITDDDGNFEDGYVETGGAQTLTNPVTINGTTYPAGSSVQNEFSMLDASGNQVWVLTINGTNIGFVYPEGEPPSPGDSFTPAVGRDGDPSDSADGVSSTEAYGNVICFTRGARILTPDGLRPVETLDVGALVTTLDAGPQPIRWMSHRFVNFIRFPEAAKPIRIKAGAIGPGVPHTDMIVSPQHRFVFETRQDKLAGEVFVPAKALTDLPGIRVMQGKRSVTYFHLALDRHSVLMAEGLKTESCYIAAPVITAACGEGRSALRAVFPQVDQETGQGYGPLARPALRVRHARDMLRRGLLDYRSDSVTGVPVPSEQSR